MSAVSTEQRQLARVVAAARSFLAEAAPVYLTRPRPLSGRLRGASAVNDFVRHHRPTIAAEDQEIFMALVLNAKHAVTAVVEIAKGTLASVDVHPREAFRPLLLHAAAAVIFVHNHPSGDPEPSADDLALTARLRDVGRLVGIPLLDHLILAGAEFVSLADRGLL